MNKTTKNIVIAVVVIIVIGVIAWMMTRGASAPSTDTPSPLGEVKGNETAPLPVSETTKVNGSLSKYQNAELGFGVEYPSAWQKADTTTGVQFVIPVDGSQVSTVNRLDVQVAVSASKCAFPPVTKVDKRDTLTVGANTFNMIAISNNVQGRSYFNRMYSLQKESICYFFTLTYIALSPESKGLTGSNLTQATNNNKAIQATADAAFTALVKTFHFVTPAAGEDETKAAPVKR